MESSHIISRCSRSHGIRHWVSCAVPSNLDGAEGRYTDTPPSRLSMELFVLHILRAAEALVGAARSEVNQRWWVAA
jgi:hypothetical protein